MKPERVSVLVADDHLVVRKGLSMVIGEAPALMLAGVAETGEQAVHLCQALAPDIVLMDIQMPGLGGIGATRQIVSQDARARVIGLSTFAGDEAVAAMFAAGARAYLLKDVSASELTETILRVCKGELLRPKLAPEPAGATAREAGAPREGQAPMGAQQARVLALMTKGFTNPEIADYMALSRPTVSYHVSAILKKLEASNRSEAVAIAVRDGLVDLTGL